jgi:hypothetical protein
MISGLKHSTSWVPPERDLVQRYYGIGEERPWTRRELAREGGEGGSPAAAPRHSPGDHAAITITKVGWSPNPLTGPLYLELLASSIRTR